ncbi:MAG: 50S ribosomal protein L9 [Caldilineae bacterium]|nr:MAG: 50S ribosomal protein L9 [Caldilineae bacterium]
MKVLLLQDVDNLGLAGDVAEVANGYGRNYLIPQKLAVLATPSALKQAEAIRRAGEAQRAREKADAEAIKGQIDGTVLVFERRAGERDKLYGSVTAQDIVHALNEKFGLDIHKRKVVLPEPIRALGEWDIPIRLMVEVSATVHVVVVKEGESYAPPVPPQPEAAEAEVAPEAEAAPEAEVETAPQAEAEAAPAE